VPHPSAAAAAPAVSAATPSHARPGGDRLAWLDALRGIAVLLVVYEHLSHFVFYPFRLAVERWFLAGYVGVCLFFLISGYLIPASLERRGSLRGFWVGRLFRLYPMYLLVLGVLVVLHLAGLRPLDPFALQHHATSAVAQATMMATLVNVPDLIGVTWTLAYEMTFYLLVAALFAAGWRRASPAVALVLAGSAVVLGTSMPAALLSHSAAGTRNVALLVALAFGLGMAAMLSGRLYLARAGAFLGGTMAAALLYTNQSVGHRFDGLVIPALMFTGTTIYRAQQREISRWWAVLVPLVVASTWMIETVRELPEPYWSQFRPRSAVNIAVIAAVFATGMLLRHRRIPRVLSWIGMISYSVYLLHLVVFDLVRPHLGRAGPSTASAPVQAGLLLGLLALMLAASAVTYRFVELPAQRLGKAVTRWLDTRLGAEGGAGGAHRAPVRGPTVPVSAAEQPMSKRRYDVFRGTRDEQDRAQREQSARGDDGGHRHGGVTTAEKSDDRRGQ
jgi:peptidoglycan/LPS O-acetylase OafA/YrhL